MSTASDELTPLDTAGSSTCRLLSACVQWRWRQWATLRWQRWTSYICGQLIVFVLFAAFTFASPLFWSRGSDLDANLRPTASSAYFIGLFGSSFDGSFWRVYLEMKLKSRILREVDGLPPYIYWADLSLLYMASNAGTALVLTIIAIFIPVLFPHSNPVLMWLVFALGRQHYTVWGFLLGRMNGATDRMPLYGWLNFILAAMAITTTQLCLSSTTQHVLLLVPLFSPYSTLTAIHWLELEGTGLTFQHLFKQCCYPSAAKTWCNDNGQYIPAGEGILAMALTNLLYLVVLYWLDQTVKPLHGVARPPHFFLQFGRNAAQSRGHSDSKYGSMMKPPAALLKDVMQVFDEGRKKALNCLNVEVRAGEVFALLGHNGSGKTTMMNCMVGIVKPTSGTIEVSGIEVGDDPTAARRQLAYCPQEAVLEEEVTVQWHLEFHAVLRGIPPADVQQEVSSAISICGLEAKRDLAGVELSGGQKRSLCLATAILGARPLLLLDEPSSGMDPASRHKLWGALETVRGRGATVLFTTHYLDEADVCSDRIAILASGEVKAVGTSMELKKDYAVGYQLTIKVREGSPKQAAAIQKLVLQHIPAAGSKSGDSKEGAEGAAQSLVFSLPFSAADSLGPLLGDLNLRRQELAVNHMGIQMSSLEDVFLQHAPSSPVAQADGTPPEAAPNRDLECNQVKRDPESLQSTSNVSKGHSDFSRQVAALLVLRMKVLTHGGSVSFITTRLVLPLSLITALFVNPGATSVPQAWASFVFGFPMGVMVIAGPLAQECDNDQRFRRKLQMFSQGMSGASYMAANVLVDYIMTLPVVLAVPLFAWMEHAPFLHGPGSLLVLAQAFAFPLHMSIFIRVVQSSTFVSRTEGGQGGLQGGLGPSVARFLGMLVPSMLVWSLLIGATSSNPWQWGTLKLAQRLHYVFSATLPPYSMSGVVLYVLFQNYSAYASGLKMMSAADFFSSTAAVPLYLAFLPTALMCRAVLLSNTNVATTGGAQPRPDQVDERGSQDSQRAQDEAVAAEEQRLANSSALADVLACRGLRFAYQSETGHIISAVRGVSLGLQRGECFGLLGPNGAGKTTTLACLTGELWPPSAGSIFFEGRDVGTEGFEVLYGKLGLCPQSDAQLWGDVSGIDHLIFYGRVKGLPDQTLEEEIHSVLERVRLKVTDAHRETSTYSGGMRRRLSLAIALLGRPPLLFLDEPSAGVDAMAKREIWTTLRQRGAEQTLLITSHQMEEVEALCDRIAIQVLGCLRALGSISDLRHRYGKGYQLEVFLPPGGEGRAPAIEKLVRERVQSGAELVECRPPKMVFQLRDDGGGIHLLLAEVFEQMSKAKQELAIKDYSLRQPTLEQVFIRFATEQQEAESSTDTA